MTRAYGDQTLVALYNFGRENETVVLKNAGRYLDLTTGHEKDLKKVRLLPGDYVWLLTREDWLKAPRPEVPSIAEKPQKASDAEV